VLGKLESGKLKALYVKGFDPTFFQEEMEKALADYCKPLGNCADWTYIGFGFFSYGGASPPKLVATACHGVEICTSTVLLVPCESEPEWLVTEMKTVAQQLCPPEPTCSDWEYRGCGLFRYNGKASLGQNPKVVLEKNVLDLVSI